MTLVLFPALDERRLSAVQQAALPLEVVNCHTADEARRAMPGATAFFGKLTPELLSAAPRLRWVQSPTASLEHYLFPELIAHPCQLSNMRGLFSDVIADHVLGLVVCFARNLHLYLRQQIEHRWAPIGGVPTLWVANHSATMHNEWCKQTTCVRRNYNNRCGGQPGLWHGTCNTAGRRRRDWRADWHVLGGLRGQVPAHARHIILACIHL